MMSLMAMMMVFLIFLIKMKKVDAASGTEWDWTKEVLENYEDRGLKKTKDGFYYTMDSKTIVMGFRDMYGFGSISKKVYDKYRKKYEGKKNCCYLIGYMGYKKKIRLPEEIEGCSRYVLCLRGMPGMKEQVKQVTIPANVRILSILQDNPVDENGDHTLYLETSPFKYKFQVEMGNKDVKSIKGLLYSKNEKILYGIPTSTRKEVIVSDKTEKVYISFGIKIPRLVLGKNVSNIAAQPHLNSTDIKELKVKKGNRHFTVKDNVLYSKDMKRLYFSISRKGGTYRMPDRVERMDRYALDGTKYRKVILSDRLKRIPFFALHIDSLEEVVIGKNVSRIDNFSGPYSDLKCITVKKGNPYFIVKNKNELYTSDGSKYYIHGVFKTVK